VIEHLRNHPRAVDAAIVSSALIIGTIDLATHENLTGPLWVNLLLNCVLAAAFGIRRRWPVGAAFTFLVYGCITSAWFEPVPEQVVPFFGLILIPYALGAWSRGRRMAVGMSLIILAPAAIELAAGTAQIGDLTFLPFLCGAAWLAGRGVRSRTLLAAELHEATVRAQEAQEEETQRAISEERRRIAREMHDIVAHSVSVMVVQAGGARRILSRDPDRAIAAAREIENTGRSALAEMRRMLGVLQGQAAEARAPQPGLAGLEALVERARAAGQPVELVVEGERRALPAGLDLAAYRVVQEALTNAIKYASGADTDVRVSYADEAIELFVADAGGGWTAVVNGGGHGLVGMQERVRLYGGEVSTGPNAGGGFEVRARIPLEQQRALKPAAMTSKASAT
jgi:signal transduction histidine kinase